MGFGCGCRRAHAKHAPGDKGSVMGLGAVAIFSVLMVVTMIADEADVDRSQQGENERLDQADEQLHEIENEKETGPVEQIFATEDVAEKTDGKREGPNGDGEHFDQADDKKHQG